MKQNRAHNISQSFSRREFLCKRIIEYGILGLIVFSPLPAAATREWSILVIQLTVIVMFVSYLIMDKKASHNELLTRTLKWPSYLFLGFFLYTVLQIIPLPKFFIKLISPNTYAFREMYSTGFSTQKFMSFSLIPSHTLREGLELLSYFLIVFLIIKTVTKRQQIIRIFSVLIAMGVFEAFYGLYELYNRNPRILFYEKIHHLDSVTGTFVNRNHFSGFLEMIIPLTIGLIIARISFFSLANLRWREKLLRLSHKGLSINLLLGGSIVVMSLAILFSKSRSGIFILFLTFVLFFGFASLFFRDSKKHEKWIKKFLNISFMIVIIISLYIGIEATLERFELEELLESGRPIFWGNTLRIFSEYPLFGTGLGTFPSIYPDLMKDGEILRIYHAHNDFLEYLTELGIVGFLLIFGGILILLYHSFILWKKRQDPDLKGLAMGGFISIFGILIHSITDFNLHIPANMLLFSVVLSLIITTTHYKSRMKVERASSERERKSRISSSGARNETI